VETLVLSKSQTPINVIHWHDAIGQLFNDEAFVLAEYDVMVHSPSTAMFVPSVIELSISDYVPKEYTKTLPFNRKNVYIRDHGRCMYCGKKVGISSFTFDHVIPQYLGGKTEWDNIVVACISCNSKKGGLLLHKAKVRLLRPPYAPRLNKAAPVDVVDKIGFKIPHETWTDYIYWNIILLPE